MNKLIAQHELKNVEFLVEKATTAEVEAGGPDRESPMIVSST